jgi:lipoyl-dependent peroxiredoxin subunit C
MTIRICKPAPDVPVGAYVRGDPDAKRLALADYRGRWVVLAFYPRDFTPVCRTELQRLAELEPAFEDEQAAVLAASTDSVHSHRAWIEGDARLAAVRYPVLADTSHKLARAFGVLTEGGAALHATFILDPAGLVRHVHVNDAGVGRSLEETLRTLQALRTGEPCPAGWHLGQRTLSEGRVGAPADWTGVNA